MEIPNYDNQNEAVTNYKRLYNFMPSQNFRLLICGPTGTGKTNVLAHIIKKPLVYYDKIYLYAKNLEQGKYQDLIKQFDEISKQVGYAIIHCSNDDIKPVNEMDNESPKNIIFDDYVCEKNQKPLLSYFIQGRHKNCSVIYLSQSYFKTDKSIRLNCSHFSIFEFPSANEHNMICRELNTTKEQYKKAIKEKFYMLINQ